MRIKLLSLLVLALYFIIIPAGAKAFSVSPPILEFEANPGETVRTSIRIQNTSDTKKVYAFTIQKFIAKGESGMQDFLPPTETKGLPEWMYFDRPVLELESGASFDLPIVIRVPENADPGGHFSAVLFAEQAELSRGAVGIVPRTGTLVFLTVRGNILKSFSLGSLSAESETQAHLPVDFSLTASNTGNVHIRPEGKLRIKNMFGNTVASYPINENGGRILPGSQRAFQMTWENQDPLPASMFSELKEEFRNFGFGKYTAEATLIVDANEQIVMTEIWIWPWRILTIALSLIVILTGVFLLRKRMHSYV